MFTLSLVQSQVFNKLSSRHLIGRDIYDRRELIAELEGYGPFYYDEETKLVILFIRYQLSQLDFTLVENNVPLSLVRAHWKSFVRALDVYISSQGEV